MKRRTLRSRWPRVISRYWRMLTSPMRLLPDFIVIGVQRGGTTSFYRYLTENPCIAPAAVKEMHFFDLRFKNGVHWYRAHFPLFLHKEYAERMRGHNLITGEATPAYLFYPLVPERVARILPRVKLIVMLRNPVDRAYSHYWLQVRVGHESLSFEEAVRREPERLREEWENVSEAGSQHGDDLRHYFRLLGRYSYLSRGLYVDQLQGWGALFPKEQMLILCSEDFYADPAASLQQVCAFLNVPNWELNEYKRYRGGKYPRMNPATREWLIDYYRPHNERLYEYLDMRFDWDK
jgi:hypothetical protein